MSGDLFPESVRLVDVERGDQYDEVVLTFSGYLPDDFKIAVAFVAPAENGAECCPGEFRDAVVEAMKRTCERIAALEAELAAARAEREHLQRGRCAYCNWGDDIDKTFEELQAHIEVCEHHPIPKLKAEVAYWKEACRVVNAQFDKVLAEREAARGVARTAERLQREAVEQAHANVEAYMAERDTARAERDRAMAELQNAQEYLARFLVPTHDTEDQLTIAGRIDVLGKQRDAAREALRVYRLNHDASHLQNGGTGECPCRFCLQAKQTLGGA